MIVDVFFNSNPARQMRLAMSAELPCKIKPRMDTNRRELLLQKEMIRAFVNAPDLFAFIRVHSWLTAIQNKTANAR